MPSIRHFTKCDVRLEAKAIELDGMNYSKRQIAEMLRVEDKYVERWLVGREPTWIDTPMKWVIVDRKKMSPKSVSGTSEAT